jgi:GT2 family glycosyltransferase
MAPSGRNHFLGSPANESIEDSYLMIGLVAVVYGQSDDELRTFADCVASLDDDRCGVWLVNNEPGRRLPALPGSVTVLESGTNTGWTGGANLGARCAWLHGCRYVLFLNTDIEILSTSLIRRLIAPLRSDPQLAIVSPGIVLADRPDRIWYRGATVGRWTWITRHPGITRPYRATHRLLRVPVACGCCMLARADVFEAVGGFDEDLFSYLDEADLCLRAAQRGWATGLLDTPLIAHDTRGRELTPVSAYYFSRNPFILMRKHSAPVLWPAMVLAQFAACPFYLWRADGPAARRSYLRGLGHGIAHLLGRPHTGRGHR